MARKLSLRTTSVLLLACAPVAALAALTRISLAENKPHLAGQWNFNQDQSDDASQKVHDAEVGVKSPRGSYPGGGGPQGGGYPSGGGYPDGGGYPGGGGGYPGGGRIGFPRGGIGGGPMGGGGIGRGGRRGGPASQGAGPSGEDLDQLAANPKMLRIEQDDKQITITDDTGQIRNLYPDGKKHKETGSSGESTAIKTHWDGDRLVAESKLGHSGKLTETYELSRDGKQLDVVSELDNSHLGAPLVIRRVYDSAAESAK
jgi:hypothetical protein